MHTIYIKSHKIRAFLGIGNNFSMSFHQKDLKKFHILKITGVLCSVLVRKLSTPDLPKEFFNNFSEHLFYNFLSLHKDKNFYSNFTALQLYQFRWVFVCFKKSFSFRLLRRSHLCSQWLERTSSNRWKNIRNIIKSP